MLLLHLECMNIKITVTPNFNIETRFQPGGVVDFKTASLIWGLNPQKRNPSIRP
jgi:hypothetical protein